MHIQTLNLLNEFSILVVEDDNLARNAIRQGLKPYCRALYEAKDGIEGLQVFKKNQIDIIITDIYMPGINGFDMMQEILYLKPQQTFIVMTSYSTDQNILNSIHEGACSFLRKPLDIMELHITLLMIKGKMKYTSKSLNSEYRIDYQKETIYHNDQPIFLSHKCNKVFWILCYNIGHLVTYEMFEDYAFDNESINKNTLHNIILRIKRQLSTIIIENIPNEGYILKL